MSTWHYPASFAEELASEVSALETAHVDSGLWQTESDYVFDISLPAIAAAMPASLQLLVGKRILYAIRFRGSKPAEISLGTSILQSIFNTSPTLGEFEHHFDVEMPQKQKLTVNLRLDYGNELPDFSGTLAKWSDCY